MAALGSLEQIFEKPLPENPTLLESLSPCKRWIRSMKPVVEDSSATEIFGELHFKEPIHVVVDPPSSSPTTSSCSSLSTASTLSTQPFAEIGTSRYYHHRSSHYKNGDSFSSDGSLSLCTEGLGSESFDEVENLLTNEQACNDDRERRYQQKRRRCKRNNNDNGSCEEETHHLCNESKISISNRSSGGFPPPLSSIGRSGKPWICLKSFREDGRFILKEIRIPTQEFLHACRENGRLTMQLMQSDDEDEDDKKENGENSADKGNQ